MYGLKKPLKRTLIQNQSNYKKALVKATTQERDYVCDPASGGYSVFECCKQLNQNFIGCDIEFGDHKIED